MPNRYIRCILLLVMFFSASATFALNIEKGLYEREGTTRPGIRIYLNANTDETREAFVDFLKQQYDLRLKGNGLFANKDELYAKKVNLKAIIDKQLNWYTAIVPASQNKYQSQITIFVSLGYDIYLSEDQYPEAFQKVYQLSLDFLKTFIPDYHQAQIKASTDLVKELEDDTSDLQKDIKRNSRKIEKLKEEIQKMETERAEKRAELDQERERLQTLKGNARAARRELRKIN